MQQLTVQRIHAVHLQLVVAFALLRSGTALRLHAADALLFAAMGCAAVGYAWGARLSQRMPAEQVICWALVLALPITVPLAFGTRPQAPLPASAWWAFGYVALFSMWLGFFAWYRGLALGGLVRVSQVQLLQPFLALIAAALVLGERPDAVTLGFAVAVLAVVLLGKRTKVA